ncbi:hypothetical protein [Myceligenerans crystallogenes]|uniref:DUF2993 domain-containing protein n=1 Tax=Myceligenerans crystallogenes TaxID=316335 RepID=A0ABN2N5A4_9MICO
MHIRITPAEVLGLVKVAGQPVPPVITSVSGEGDVVRVVADLRRIDALPGPLKLAVRIAPIVRADVRVVAFVAGVATLQVEANAAGMPAHKLLSMAAGPIEQALAQQKLPPGVVDIQQDARIAVDVERLLEAKLPGLTVTNLRLAEGEILLDGSVG